MQEDNKFIILRSLDGVSVCIKLIEAEFGKIATINFLGEFKKGYEILFGDSSGENVYSKIEDSPFSVSLGESFNIDNKVLVDLFFNNMCVASSSIENIPLVENNFKSDYNQKETKSDYDYLNEAEYYILKAKELSQEQPKEGYFDSIKSDFELLYSIGEEDYLLSKKFCRSEWRKVEIGSEIYLLGKIYSRENLSKTQPDYVAIAEPKINSGLKTSKSLGKFAKFYHCNIYDDFGFLVLIQSAMTGKPYKS